MLKIRLQRFGKKNQPSYRVVLVEHTAPPRGKFQEILGSYNPKTKQKNFKKERIAHWLSKGVQLSPTVHNLLVNEGILKKEKIKAWKPKKPAESPGGIPASNASRSDAGWQAGPPASQRGEPKSEGFGGEEKPSETKPAETKAEEKP